MFPIGKKTGPAVGGVLCQIEGGYWNWLTAGGRHTIDRFVDVGSKKNHITCPRSTSPIRCGRQAHRWTAGQVKPLQLLVGEEADGSSIRRPEGKLAALRARYRFYCCTIHGTQEQHLLASCHSHKYKIAAVMGDTWGPGLVAKREQCHIRRQRESRSDDW